MPCFTEPGYEDHFGKEHGHQATAVACWMFTNVNVTCPEWVKTWHAQHARRDALVAAGNRDCSPEWRALLIECQALSRKMRELGV